MATENDIERAEQALDDIGKFLYAAVERSPGLCGDADRIIWGGLGQLQKIVQEARQALVPRSGLEEAMSDHYGPECGKG